MQLALQAETRTPYLNRDMWIALGVSALAAGLVALPLILLRDEWRTAPRGWQLLAGSGVALALGGLDFIVRFWEPLPGPYQANELYPLGPYVNAWAVSFGFMWLAFGALFVGFALRGPRTALTWLILVATWVVAWIPHGIVAIGFAAAGDNEASLQLYRDSASDWPGLLRLSASGVILLAHVGLSTLGFALTGKKLLRQSVSA